MDEEGRQNLQNRKQHVYDIKRDEIFIEGNVGVVNLGFTVLWMSYFNTNQNCVIAFLLANFLA